MASDGKKLLAPPAGPRPLFSLSGWLALIPAAVMALFFLTPLALAIEQAFVLDGRFSFYWFGRILANEMLLAQMLNALILACATTLLCLLLSLPLAILRARTSFPGQQFLSSLLLVPMILPPFVGAVAMKQMLGQFGTINIALERIGLLNFSRDLPPDWLGAGFFGVVLLQTLHLFPIIYLNVSASLANIDPAYGQAARNLGAGQWRTFFRITLPLLRPGIFAGGTIVFIWSLTDIGTPLLLGYHNLTAVTIFKELARANFSGWTFGLVFLLLGTSVTLYVLGKFIFGRPIVSESSKASISQTIRRLSPVGIAGAWVLHVGTIFMALLPHIGVALMAFSDRWVNTVVPERYTLDHILFVVNQPATYRSIVNSIQYSAAATAIDIVIGLMAAWLIVRSKVRWRTILDGVMMLPLAVPGMILAAGYVAMTAKGPLEAIGPLKNPTLILIIAYAVRRIPLVVRGVSAGLEQTPVSLEEAARNLGSSPLGARMRITLPLIASNVIAAAVLVFAFSMLEVSDSLILAQTENFYPISKQIYMLASSTGAPQTVNQAAALGLYGMALLTATLVAAGVLMGRKLGGIFRA